MKTYDIEIAGSKTLHETIAGFRACVRFLRRAHGGFTSVASSTGRSWEGASPAQVADSMGFYWEFRKGEKI